MSATTDKVIRTIQNEQTIPATMDETALPLVLGNEKKPEIFEVSPLLINLEEAAAFIGIPSSTLHTWAWQGKVPCVRLGRSRLFRREDLERWVENHTCPAKK